MFFKLSNNQIKSAKINSFPQTVDDYDAIVTSKGSDNNIKIIINIIDGINRQYKVFNNLAAQKYMKLKIFEINSDNMKNDLETAVKSENPSAIEEIIRKYGVAFKTLSAAYDFKGDVYKLKNRNNYSGITRLKYETDLLLPRETINYFSLGIYFYYDLPTYLKQINVEERFIDKAITWDKLHIFSLYANNKIVSGADVKDLRKIKSIFNQSSFLDNLNANINLENAFNKKLEDSRKNKSINQYFSKAYFSRTQDKKAGFVFNFDFKKIIENNSAYKNIVKDSIKELYDIYSETNKILDLKISKRQVFIKNKNNNEKIEILKDTEQKLISTSFLKNQNKFFSASDDYGKIVELSTNNSFGDSIKTMSVVDNKAFQHSNAIYQYGVQITIKDSLAFLFKFLSDKHISESISILKYYLSLLDDPKNYDPTENSITSDFVIRMDSDKKLQQDISNSIDSFILILKVFGIYKNVDEGLQETLISIFNPKNVNIENISYFIKVYEKVQAQVVKLSKNKYENVYTIENWFSDFLDTQESIDYGFRYFDNITTDGVGIIDGDKYIDKITNEVKKYSTDTTITNQLSQTTLFSYVSPTKIILPNNKIIDLEALSTKADALSLEEYAKHLIEIKKINFLSNLANDQETIPGNYSSKSGTELLNSVSLMSEIIGNSASIVTNLIQKPIKQTTLKNKKKILKKESGVNTSLFMLEVINHLNIDGKTFYNIEKNNNGILISSNVTPDMPLHLQTLIQNKSKLFNATDKYLQNIELYTKFLLLYNTIHQVEFLTYEKDLLSTNAASTSLNKEKWRLLDKNSLESFINGSLYLCRLKSYVNTKNYIKGIQEIDLPIYDEHFLFRAKNINTIIDIPAPIVAPSSTTPVAERIRPLRPQPTIPAVPLISPEVLRIVEKTKIVPAFKPPKEVGLSQIVPAISKLNNVLNNSNINIGSKIQNNLNNLLETVKIPLIAETARQTKNVNTAPTPVIQPPVPKISPATPAAAAAVAVRAAAPATPATRTATSAAPATPAAAAAVTARTATPATSSVTTTVAAKTSVPSEARIIPAVSKALAEQISNPKTDATPASKSLSSAVEEDKTNVKKQQAQERASAKNTTRR